MDKTKRKKISNLAWKIMLDEEESELPVNISKICNDLDIKVLEIGGIFHGYSTCKNEKAIFYNRNIKDVCEKRYTIAHELGHILLKQFDITYEEKEIEADVFASRILTPIGILYNMEIHSP